MYNKEDRDIVEHLLDCYPEEGCGILLNKRGKVVWIPCKNEAEDKLNNFKIPAEDYIKATLQGDIYAIVHSHPDSDKGPSENDIASSNFLGVPYIVFTLPEIQKFTHNPIKKSNPLLGRTYDFGTNDCYSLVRDYYREKLNIELSAINFEDNWWNKGLNYFDDLYEAFGWYEVETPQEHDMIIFSVLSNIPNHCGVYLGEGLFLHHAENRLSCRESIYSGWSKHITRYIRCKQFA